MSDSAAAQWARLVANRREGRGTITGRGEGPAARMAAGLRAASRRDMTQTPLFQAVVGGLGGERSVLDLGAGTGRYTVPLVRAGCRVWALEPSSGMREYLSEELAALSPAEAGRVQVVPQGWPEGRSAVPPVEVVLASLVVHFCEDPVAFIEAMAGMASRRCVIGIRVAQMHPLADRLWSEFHPERPFPAQPVLADLQAVLREMGVTPEVLEHEAVRPYGRYATQEEARADAVRLLDISVPEDLARLDHVLSTVLVAHGDGWVIDGGPAREAVVYWTPRRVKQRP